MSDNEHMRTIEIEGVKIEVDMRTAKKIESYKVGSKVKLLLKTYSGYDVHPGVICGIDCFKNLPTLTVCYIKSTFANDGCVHFAYLNAETKETEIAPMMEDDIMPNRATIIDYFNKSIDSKLVEVEEMRTKKEYFLRQYGTAFGVGAEEVAEATAN